MKARQVIQSIEETYFGRPMQPTVDATRFGDSLSGHTTWEPLRKDAANFRTHQLKQEPDGSLVYRPSAGILVFAAGFIVASLAVASLYISGINQANYVLPIATGLLLLGLILLVLNLQPVRFDTASSEFSRGWQKHKGTAFSEIHALQLLHRISRVSTDNDQTRYITTYELNLIRHDASRRHIMNYSQQPQARTDAKRIAELLHVPLWDAS